MNKLYPLLTLLFFFGFGSDCFAQEEFAKELYRSYPQFKEEALQQRRFAYSDIEPLLKELRESKVFKIKKVGESIEGRDLNQVSIGKGSVEVLLWSQMHGDESTATMALFDIFKFFESEEFKADKELILSNLSIHFLPMLNPDGAQVFERRNALGVDVNRDALRLQSPESQTLKRVRDSLEADFGFNLHDQSRYYNAERTEKPATISFLAPAYNYEKDINEVRSAAMKLIVEMNEILQEFAPGQVGRYNDDFEPRAFGDNIQKWGTSTILIESGGYPQDREKQEIRKLNFVAILSALKAIATETYKERDLAAYEEIPENDRMLFDLKLTGVNYNMAGKDYVLDLGINLGEAEKEEGQGFYYVGRIADQGDLSTSYAYEELKAENYQVEPGKIYPQVFENSEEIREMDFADLLAEGYAFVRLRNLPEKNYTSLPVNLVSEDFQVPRQLRPGMNPTFFLTKNGQIEYAVVNGFLFQPSAANEAVENALIFH